MAFVPVKSLELPMLPKQCASLIGRPILLRIKFPPGGLVRTLTHYTRPPKLLRSLCGLSTVLGTGDKGTNKT